MIVFYFLSTFIVVGLTVQSVMAVASEEWNIEKSTVEQQRVLDFVATEGTWMSLDVSPDGETVVFELLGHIYEMPIAGGEAVPLTTGRSWNMFPRYSPDGRRLLITSDRGGTDDLWVMERASGELKNISNMPVGIGDGSWSADGRFLYGAARYDEAGGHTLYQFSFHGSHQLLTPSVEQAVKKPIHHFRDDPKRDLIYFEQFEGESIFESRMVIKTYNKQSGEVKDYIRRPGGALAPELSPDGRYLAYVHRRDQVSELVLRNLNTGVERILVSEIERDHQDFPYNHTAYPGMGWSPDSEFLVIWFKGSIHRVDIDSGAASKIPFRAQVQRKLDPTIRFRQTIAEGKSKTRIHRWAQRIPEGVLFETLGDLYLYSDGHSRNITRSYAHESGFLYDLKSRKIYFSSWADDELGALYSQRLDGKKRRKLTTVPSQYGAPALSPDGKKLAFVRGDTRIRRGISLERQVDLELITMTVDGKDQVKVTDVSWAAIEIYGPSRPRPPAVRYSADGRTIFFTEFDNDDKLVLKRIGLNGNDEQTLYRFPHGSRALISPDEKWVLYQEYHRTYLTPFEFVGQTIIVSAEDGVGTSKRIDAKNDGLYHRWSNDSKTILWTRGSEYFEKSLETVLAESEADIRPVNLAVSYDVDTPRGSIALTNARILTMNSSQQVFESATLLVRDNRIEALGTAVNIPKNAHVIDLKGRTLMPGIVDVHAHYDSRISPTHVIEQRVASLRAALANGVTTMYEVYGAIPKDTWLSDMLRAGKTVGPRLFTVGTPMYGSRKLRPRTYRSFKTYEDVAEHVRFNKAHGATALKDYITPGRRMRHQLATVARAEGLNVVVEPGMERQTNLTRVIDGATGIAHAIGFNSVYQDYVEFFAANKLGITATLNVTLDGPKGENYFFQRERLWENEKLVRFANVDDLVARLRRPRHIFEDDYFHPELAANLKKLHDSGVSMQLGGHGELLGLDVHFEMELYSHGGFSNMEVLNIATLQGARHQGLDRDLGSLEAGKVADLIVLKENPLDNIRNTRSVELVMKSGILYSGKDAGRVYPDPQPAGKFYFK